MASDVSLVVLSVGSGDVGLVVELRVVCVEVVGLVVDSDGTLLATSVQSELLRRNEALGENLQGERKISKKNLRNELTHKR